MKAVKDGKLIPHDDKTGLLVVDYNTLPRKKDTQEEIEKQIRAKKKYWEEIRRSQAHHFDKKYQQPHFDEIFCSIPEDEIKDKARWIYKYTNGLPVKPTGCMCEIFTVERVKKYIYKAEEVLSLLKESIPSIAETQKLCSTENHEKEPAQSDNYFKRNGDYWTIRYEGKESKPVKHVNGLLYIAHLLKKPGTSISCKDLYQSVSGNIPDKVMTESAAIGECLNIGSNTQAIKDKPAHQAYAKKYLELQNSLNSVESDIERREIEEEMNKLLPYMQEKTFVSSDKKNPQSNIKKRIDTAYEKLLKANMKPLEKHLRQHIKNDDFYGLQYTGSVPWEIIE